MPDLALAGGSRKRGRGVVTASRESHFGKRFVRMGDDAMVRQHCVGKHFDVPLRHVTANAVISPREPPTARQLASRERVTSQTPPPIVSRRLGRLRHRMNPMTREAAQTPFARAVTFAHLHRKMVR